MSLRSTRRRFIRDGAVVAITTTTALDAFMASDAVASEPDLFAARFVASDGPHAALVEIEGRIIRVVLAPGAEVVQGPGDALCDASAFINGEAVVFRGQRGDDGVVAVEFQSQYVPMAGEITVQHDAERFDTSAGQLRVPMHVRERDDSRVLTVGDRYFANVWVDPKAEERVALVFRVL